MATMVTRGSSQLPSSISIREKSNRNKRKFRADPPLPDSSILNPSPHGDCINYDFFNLEKFSEISNVEQHTSFCDVCRTLSWNSREDLGFETSHDVDWSNFTENKLEEIILNNLNEIFNESIKVIVSHGYTDEVATNAVLSYGICYRCKYTVSDIVENALSLLRSGREVDSSPRVNTAEDLKKLARSVLADMVNVLRTVRPFFSVGDAMWCLLICDLNVSHACDVECDALDSTCYEEKCSSNPPQLDPEGTPHSSVSQQPLEVEVSSNRKNYHISSFKRDSGLRDKSLHSEDARVIRSKSALRSSKHDSLGELPMNGKVKSASDSPGVSGKCNSVKLSKAGGLDSSQIGGSFGLSLSDVPASLKETSAIKLLNSTHLTVANTELSLSLLPSTSSSIDYGFKADKTNGNWIAQGKKDELLLKLVPRVRELEAQKQDWTEWAQHKIMQAAHRLSKDKPELQTLRQEKEEVIRLKKEKHALEENTKKKLIEMENALFKASNQIEEANATAQRLDVENLELRKEMKAAKMRADESAASCQEVSKREMKALKKFQSWDREKLSLQEELISEKRKFSQIQQHYKNAKEHHDLMETRWRQERKSKAEVLLQLKSERKDREKIEVFGKLKENEIAIEAENELQRFKDDIRRLERQLTQLRLASDSSKLASFGWGADGTYASRLADCGKSSYFAHSIAKLFPLEEQGNEDVQRERECVMCLSEEMSVVFLPCAHQVVCTACNDLHEKQGMKDCPSCRTSIQQRICVRHAHFTG